MFPQSGGSWGASDWYGSSMGPPSGHTHAHPRVRGDLTMCLYACGYTCCVQGAAPAPTQLTFDNAYNFHGSGHVMGAAVSPMQEFNVQLAAPAHHPFGLHHDTGAGQTRPAPAR